MIKRYLIGCNRRKEDLFNGNHEDVKLSTSQSVNSETESVLVYWYDMVVELGKRLLNEVQRNTKTKGFTFEIILSIFQSMNFKSKVVIVFD